MIFGNIVGTSIADGRDRTVAIEDISRIVVLVDQVSSRISSIADIGLAALNGPLDAVKKTEFVKQLQSMKQQTDVVEIRILDEIESLVNGKLQPLPVSYSMF